jgi:homoserine acetyltransferase
MKKRLLIIGIFIIVVTLITTVIVLSSGVSDSFNIEEYLTSNGYKLVDEDASQYIKETNTLENFDTDRKNNKDSSYLAYYFSLPSKTFKEYKMSFSASKDTTVIYTLSNRLNTSIIEFNYEISDLKVSYTLEGKYDMETDTFKCEMINNNLVNKESYCSSVMKKINDFISKRSELLKNEDVKKAINTTQNEVKVKE